MLEYLFIAFLVLFGIQFIYYTFILGSFSFSKTKSSKNNFNEPVSVIICAKNDAENLIENIPFFLNQNYKDFELVLINDNSYDHTLAIIEQFQKEHPLKIIIVNVSPNEQFWGNKKYALTLGIKAASNNHLLFSDADCKPTSKDWITEMVNNFEPKTEIVLGYGAYEKVEKSFLNKIIRFETLLTAIQYFSYAKIGIPYMGVGRNLGYTKEVFFKNNGFVKHMKIKSGDDDLFINQVATKNNTSICTSKNSFTVSKQKISFSSWFQQKRRQVFTTSHFKPIHKTLLGLFYVSQLLFWILAFILLINGFQWQITLALVLTRLTMQYLTIGYAAKKLDEKDLVLFFPLYELFLIFAQMFIFIKNLISKPSHW